MFCKRCGKQIKEGALFCQYCGTKAVVPGDRIQEESTPVQSARKDSGSPVPKAGKAAAPGSRDLYDNGWTPPVRREPIRRPGRKPRTARVLIVFLFLVLTGIIAALLFYIFFPRAADDKGEGRDTSPRYARAVADAKDGAGSGGEESEPSAAPSAEPQELVPTPVPDLTQEPQEPEQQDESGNGYILPDSASRYLTVSDLEGFTKEECRLARNELYARHGRRFDDEGLQAYFDSCEWYNGTIAPGDFDDSVMNEYEVANRDLIVQYEKDMGYR